MKVLYLNGPNLNMLGIREPTIYGALTLKQIEHQVQEKAQELGIQIEFRQSNHEGSLIDWIHEASGIFDAIILNAGAYTHTSIAGAYTHTSIAIRDAVSSIKVPVVEIHLSNVHAREEFRKKSFIAPVCAGVIAGFGAESYTLALIAVSGLLAKQHH